MFCEVCPEGMQISYRKNSDLEPISTLGPETLDREHDKRLLAELRRMGAFEEEDKDSIRAEALSDIDALVSDWAIAYSERNGKGGLDRRKACLMVPFGSYCLGVHSNESDIDVLAILPRHVDRLEFVRA